MMELDAFMKTLWSLEVVKEISFIGLTGEHRLKERDSMGGKRCRRPLLFRAASS
jgi:hypothetical protein